MLTRSGLGAVLSGIVLGVLGVWWGYEELVIVATAIGMIMLGDVVIHTWDLARATGLDETLDGPIVSEMLVGMLPMDEMLRQSGQYGPRVHAPDNADVQTKLLAFIGRTP